MHSRAILGLAIFSLAVGGCMKKQQAKHESDQNRLIGQTFAGKNACNPENDLRPFIIEWDATDMSSFESHAASDIVVVRYEGCNLSVLDACRNDSLRGEQGSYLPPQWTSGSLESLEISNEGELVAKLPLANATLGGRVQAGEKFHMEYYVAGTRNASRDAVYQSDLASNPGCAGATHFVYGYNLGAFALGSANEINTQAGVSVFGFGAQGTTASSRKAEKKGGSLPSCHSDSATEIEGCKAPIRLSLRRVRDGENPESQAMSAPDTDESLNAAGMVNMKVEMSQEARARYEAATRKMAAGDGKGCLMELDAHDKLDPSHKSTDAKSTFGFIRAQCLMAGGKCDAGKLLFRKSLENTTTAAFGPKMMDKQVEGMASMYCQGKMSDRDALLKALNQLQQGAYMAKKTAKFCDVQVATIERLKGKVKPKNEDDTQLKDVDRTLTSLAPNCYARAGDCARAFEVFKHIFTFDNQAEMEPTQLANMQRSVFEGMVSRCKDK